MDTTVIISYRESTEERKENLKHVLEYMSTLQNGGMKILIVEQDAESKMDWLEDVKGHENIKHIFVENDGIFNKGWGYNIGAKNTDSEILIFHDSDMFIKPQAFNSALKALNFYDVVNPYKSVIFLDKESTDTFTKNNYRVGISKSKPIIHSVITGGIFFIKRDIYFNLKGFDEDCYGYGHEDDILDEKMRKMGLKINTLNDVSIHIYHKTATDNNDLYYSFIEINKQLFKEYQDMTKIQLIEKLKTIDTWGDIDISPIRDTSTRHLKREMYEQTTEKVIDHMLSKMTDELLDEIVSSISTKIYNSIIESVTEKVKDELSGIKYSVSEKESMLKRIMKNFKL